MLFLLAFQTMCCFITLKYLPSCTSVKHNHLSLILKMGAQNYLALYLIPFIIICIYPQIYSNLLTLPADCNSTKNDNTYFIGGSAFLSLLGSCEIIIDKFDDKKCVSKSSIVIWTKFDSKLVTINCNSSQQLDVSAVFEKNKPTQSTTRVEFKQYSTVKHNKNFTRIYSVKIRWSAEANLATKFIVKKRDHLKIVPTLEQISILLVNRVDGKSTIRKTGDILMNMGN